MRVYSEAFLQGTGEAAVPFTFLVAVSYHISRGCKLLIALLLQLVLPPLEAAPP